jgi:probable HAF family extracellular repeat protein
MPLTNLPGPTKRWHFCFAVGIATLLGTSNAGGQTIARHPVAPMGMLHSHPLGTAREHTRYRLIVIGTFGGPNSAIPEAFLALNGGTAVRVISDDGTVAGIGDTATADPSCYIDDCFFPNAFRWREGVLTDLGTLPGDKYSGSTWISRNGLIVGLAENGQSDPLVGVPEMRGVLWSRDRMLDLGTLQGGYETFAFAVNNRGQVAGAATNTVPDVFSIFGAQIRPFLWQGGSMKDLGTLGGPEGVALLVNDRGQVAGYSFPNATANANNGPCQANAPAQEPFFYSNGRMVDIGTFGGTCGITNALNNRGQVAGQSYTSGNAFARAFLWDGKLNDLGTLGGQNADAEWLNDAGDVVGYADLQSSGCMGLACIHHAALWKEGKITDLGTLSGDPCSRALSINERGQIVGASALVCGGNFSHALLFEHGRPVDLNTVIAPGSGLTLTDADYINDRGEIAGGGSLPNGDRRAYLLIPCESYRRSDCEEVSFGVRAPVTHLMRSVATPTQRGDGFVHLRPFRP